MLISDISIIMRKMRVFAEKSLAEYGLGFPEQLVLMHLTAHGNSNQESIATTLDIDKGAVTKTIGKLEAKGFVTRELNPDNRREKIVALTKSAEPVIHALGESFTELQAVLFTGMNATEIEQMCKGVEQVATNLAEATAAQKEL